MKSNKKNHNSSQKSPFLEVAEVEGDPLPDEDAAYGDKAVPLPLPLPSNLPLEPPEEDGDLEARFSVLSISGDSSKPREPAAEDADLEEQFSRLSMSEGSSTPQPLSDPEYFLEFKFFTLICCMSKLQFCNAFSPHSKIIRRRKRKPFIVILRYKTREEALADYEKRKEFHNSLHLMLPHCRMFTSYLPFTENFQIWQQNWAEPKGFRKSLRPIQTGFLQEIRGDSFLLTTLAEVPETTSPKRLKKS